MGRRHQVNVVHDLQFYLFDPMPAAVRAQGEFVGDRLPVSS
jgi:hypothetical protein